MIDLKNYVNCAPSVLTIAPTYRCTAACKECCFRCTPQVKQILETDSLNDEVNEWENDTTTYHSEAKPY